ncbi:S41 family peptidase [Clostridium hydrogenum]|uniref:hypothetical protein n=1 Tax=Clostridium hydrogenum TaxID=2855764 RepID=UPI001F2A70BB|nr:hypothetical protein [Clostridium hydrogenum]
MKLLKKIFIIFLCLSLCSCGGTKVNNNSSKYLAAIDEFEGFYEIKDPFLYENVSKKQWTKAISDLKEDVKTKQMSEDDIYYRLKEISAMLKDSHDNCFKTNNSNEKCFPIWCRYYNDKFYVLKVDNKFKNILGGQILAINGIKFSDIEKRYSKILSAENTQWLRAQIAENGFTEADFKYLGILKENNIFKIKKINGHIQEVTINAVSPSKLAAIGSNPNNYSSFGKTQNMISSNKPANQYSQYWFTLDKKNRILYFQYNTCIDKYDKVLNTGIDYSKLPSFIQFGDSLIQFMHSNLNNFDKIVVDVRNNQGGNPDHLDNLIDNNLSLFNSKKVYVLMSKYTFSAGVEAVNSLVKKCNATMVGEETGGSIKMHSVQFDKLSNIGITIEYGTEDGELCSSAGRNSSNNRDGAIPDIKVNETINDLANGVDSAYQKVVYN